MRVDESRQIGDQDRTSVRELIAAAAEADGVRPVSEQGELNLDARPTVADGPERGPALPLRHLMVRGPGELVGYAQVDGDGAELVVHPDHRRRGIGTALLDVMLGSLPAGADRPKVWAHGFIPAAQAFAQARGLTVVRQLWQMTLPVGGSSPSTSPALPDAFEVSRFTEDDIDDWVAVNARAFATHPEQGRMTSADVRDRMAQPWFDAAGFLLVRDPTAATPATDPGSPIATPDPGTPIATPDPGTRARSAAADRGRLVAFHWTKIDPGVRPRTGEVYVVGIDPAYQGRGLSGPVTALGIDHLVSRGVDRVTLYVDGDNARAIATYRNAGFERTALDVMLAD